VTTGATDAESSGRRTVAGVMPETTDTTRTAVRWRMLWLIVLVMFVNYMDRGNLAIVAPVIQNVMNLDATGLGMLFSAFTWTYLLSLPFAGLLLDRFGPRITLAVALIGWSVFTIVTGVVDSFATLLACRMGLGLFESPAIPTNMRCVSAWFPERQRGLAIGCYSAAQSVAVGLTAPALTWVLLDWGWRPVFYATGGAGLLAALIWHRFYRDPCNSTRVSREEWVLIRDGGGLVEAGAPKTRRPFSWRLLARLFRERQLLGMFIGQYAVMTTLYFFLTWFPSYLSKAKGLTLLQSGHYAVVPFLLAVLGALAGGRWSDWMVGKGASLGLARKAPVILGFVLASSMVLSNYTNDIRLVIALLGLAFFGQAMASTVTGALLTDVAPKDALGLTGGLVTFFANLGSALCPLIVGLLIQRSGGFELGLVYVSGVSVLGAGAYIFVVGPVRRIELVVG
jgi:ACS family D-galactonate transporter-like MFS transporter